MPRRSYRRPYRSKKYKWSIEYTATRVLVGPINNSQDVPIVSPSYEEGTRCVKNFDIQITSQASLTTGFAQEEGVMNERNNLVVFWALVYVPHGYDPRDLNLPNYTQDSITERSTDFYLANQFVITAGVQSMHNPTFRIRTRMARNLNSGDRIYLVLEPVDNGPQQLEQIQMPFNILTKYAICYK